MFSCMYRQGGNGIIERKHRTIKWMVARSGKAPEDMVFWYNNSPNSQGVVPAAAVFQYDVRIPGETSLPKSTNHPDSGSYEV